MNANHYACELWSALSFPLSATEWGRGPGRGGALRVHGPNARRILEVKTCHGPPVENVNAAKLANYNRSGDNFPPGRRYHPLPGGEGRGEGERKSKQFMAREQVRREQHPFHPLSPWKPSSPRPSPPGAGGEGERIFCGVVTQGGARCARLPWAIILLPLRGVEAQRFSARNFISVPLYPFGFKTAAP
jgi:hypothetical protein